MTASLLSSQELRSSLAQLSHAQIQRLAKNSNVPLTTLWKIKDSTTKNPGIETMRKFYGCLLRMHHDPSPPSAQQESTHA